MNFDQASKLPRSEKITLMTVEAVERAKIFTDLGSGVYSRDVSHFAVKVKDGTSKLTQVYSTPVNNNEFYYNPLDGKLYVKLDENPKLKNLSITYRFFYSTANVTIPFDLNSGVDVYFDARIESIGSIGQQLDEENIGIVLESQSNAQLINSDGYFDEIFDTLIWENQEVKFYSWIYGTPISEIKKIFDGVVESKDFGQDRINLKVRDFVFRLQNQVNLPLFSTDDGDISPSILGTPKRRIYGRVNQVQCVGLDNVLDGYPLTGTLTFTQGSDIVSGTGTDFLKELSPDDEIFFIFNNEEVKFTVRSITSGTSIVVTDEANENINLVAGVKVSPQTGYRFKNRAWHICETRLSEINREVIGVRNARALILDSVNDLYQGDTVQINGITTAITRISGETVFLEQFIFPVPVIGDIITRPPLNTLYWGSRRLEIERDYFLNNSSEAFVTLYPYAEFNVIKNKKTSFTFSFTNGSNNITTVSDVDLRTILKSRDFIRKQSQSINKWYEILSVEAQSFTIRESYDQSSGTEVMLYKSMEFITDDSLVTADCYGIERDGGWIKTPAQATRDLVLNDAQFSQVNEPSFTKANDDCNYIVSMVIPDTIGSESPKIKDEITKINESVFGSLYGDSAFNVSYSILNAEKPEDTEILIDDDIVSWESTSTQKIVNKIKVNYSPFVDKFNGESGFKTLEFNNGFVDSLIGINNTLERTLYLYEDDKAEIIAQRLALFNSLSSTVITVKAKLNLALKAVGDKMFLSLDRLYKRYGGKDKRKIGTITGIKKNGYDTDVTFVDLANVYNRVPAIAPDSTLDYSFGVSDDYVRFGHIVDNDTESPDSSSEMQLGNNLIG